MREQNEDNDSRPDEKINESAGEQILGLIFLVVFLFIIMALIGTCSFGGGGSKSSKFSIPYEDRKAYDALRSKGYSDYDARNAAPSIRRLCEASGGRDCQ